MLKKIYINNLKADMAFFQNFELKCQHQDTLLSGDKNTTNSLCQVLAILQTIVKPEALVDNHIRSHYYVYINKPIEFKLDIEIDNIQYQYNLAIQDGWVTKEKYHSQKIINEELFINGKNIYTRNEHGHVIVNNIKVRTLSDSENKVLLNIATYPVEFKTIEEFEKLKPIQDWFHSMLLLSPELERMITDVHDYSDVLDTHMGNLSSWLFVLSQQYPAFYDKFKTVLKTILPEFENIMFKKELSEAIVQFNIDGFIEEIEFHQLTDNEKMMFAWTAAITLTNFTSIPFVFLQSFDNAINSEDFLKLISKIQPKCSNQQMWIATNQIDVKDAFQNCDHVHLLTESRFNPVLKHIVD